MPLTDGTAAQLRTALATNAAAAEVRTLLNELDLLLDSVDVVVNEQTITLTNAVNVDLAATIPAGAILLSAAMNLDTLIAGDASGDNLLAKVGLGTNADPDAYGITASLVKNVKSTRMLTPTYLASATTLQVGGVKTDGSAATEKFVAGGIVSVKVTYLVARALPDAA